MTQPQKQRLATIVGANITAQRRLKGLNQAEFAEKLGIGADSLSRIERGLVAPRFTRLEQIAELLECPVYVLFQTEEDRKNLAIPERTQLTLSEIELCTKREVTLLAEKIIQLMR